MKDRKKLKLKKFYFHPITMFVLSSIIIIVLSGIFSLFEMQGTYSTINEYTNELEPTLLTVENLFSISGIKYILSNAMKNFVSFGPLGTLLISIFAITLAEATGMIETFTKKYLSKLPRSLLTFIIILIATCSSLINEVGYAILIPLAGIIYFINKRNPMLGIATAFCGVSFGYGVSIFVGSQEMLLMDYTKTAALLIDETTHIALTSNLYFSIVATIILSIVGTIIIEKIIAPRIGKYKKEEEFANTEQYSAISIEEEEQKLKEKEKREKTGIKNVLIVSIIYLLILIYSLIPGLPGSGILLNMNEKTYAAQVIGSNSYLQNGFTYFVALFFISAGIAYAIGAKSIKNDKALFEKMNQKLSKIGTVLMLTFVASQFIAILKKTNIGLVFTVWLANILEYIEMNGFILILITLILIAMSGFLVTSSANKWAIFSPIVVPIYMQANISPEFAQVVMRAADSMTKGFTPVLASFIIYIGYLNIYNLNKEKPITIKKSFQMISPYFLIILFVWIALVIGWYIVGLPIGPGVYPTI